MRFDPIDTFDPASQTTGPVARPRKWPPLLIAVVTSCVAVVLIVSVKDNVFRLVIGLPLLLFALVFFASYRRLCARRAWLLAVDSQGLSVMLRSPFRAPADEREATVVTLPWREIAWVGSSREQRMIASKNETTFESYGYLDVAVQDVDLALLAAKVEEAFETPSSWKNAHRQSTLVEGNVLRLQFRGPSVSTTPSLKAVLRAIDGKTTVRDELKIG